MYALSYKAGIEKESFTSSQQSCKLYHDWFSHHLSTVQFLSRLSNNGWRSEMLIMSLSAIVVNAVVVGDGSDVRLAQPSLVDDAFVCGTKLGKSNWIPKKPKRHFGVKLLMQNQHSGTYYCRTNKKHPVCEGL